MIAEVVEHLDELEVTLIYTQQYEYAIEFLAVEIIATRIAEGTFSAERGWTKKGALYNMDLVYDPHEAEPYLSGNVKYDGCSNVQFAGDGYIHLCGPEGIQRMSKLLPTIFVRCGELLGSKALDGVFERKL